LQGDGGDGKTQILQQLQTSCATNCLWLGLPVEECISVGFYTEDDDRTLHTRQEAINSAYGVTYAELSRMLWFPRGGEENEIVVFERNGRAALTPFYFQIREAVLDHQAKLLVLDVAVDLFGGDENARRQVRTFLRLGLQIAREIEGYVVLSAHPSQAGIRSEGGHSGSTDWSNGVRSRLFLSRPEAVQGEENDDNARLLTRKKANFARRGDKIELHWKDGVLALDALQSRSVFRRQCEDVYLALLDARNASSRQVSDKTRASNYAPKVFAAVPKSEREGYTRRDFDRAHDELFRVKKIMLRQYGFRSANTFKIVRADASENISTALDGH
jgi:RecA-family ATPase